MATKTTIAVLPPEMLLEIFQNLRLHQLVTNCATVSPQWWEIIAKFILKPKILRLANCNGQFKREITQAGWTEESNQLELIISLYQKKKLFQINISKQVKTYLKTQIISDKCFLSNWGPGGPASESLELQWGVLGS